jgi:CDP-glycerol glycerophosphotransferase (TagB/SpsB family)
MLHGLFLDPRIWKIDVLSSPCWNTEKYGIKIDLHPNAFRIWEKGALDKKYKFAIATEVWEIPMRRSLKYLRHKGLKIFLLPRETLITEALKDLLFEYPKFLHNGEYYFKPDAVFAPNKIYADFWKEKTNVVVTGYPRFDYLFGTGGVSRSKIVEKYGLSSSKKIIFFPSYPPYCHKADGSFFDVYDGRELTLRALEGFAQNNNEYQVVVKIHPMSFKCYKKGTGRGKEVAETLLKYYKNPTDYMKVIGDVRMSGNIAKELLLISDIVVGFKSTMLLEALALDKYVMHLLLGNTVDVNFTAYKDHMPTVYSKEDMWAFIKNPYKIDSKQAIENYLFRVDGKSCQRICDAIKKYVPNEYIDVKQLIENYLFEVK